MPSEQGTLADRTLVISGGSRGIGLAIAVGAAKQNCLWPQTYIATAAVAKMDDGDSLVSSARSPEIMADAAVEILSRPAQTATGNCYIDADVLTESGVVDLSRYGGGANPILDIFLD